MHCMVRDDSNSVWIRPARSVLPLMPTPTPLTDSFLPAVAGPSRCATRGGSWPTAALSVSMPAIRVSRKRWGSSKWPVKGSSSSVILARMLDRASCASTFRLRSPTKSAATIARPDPRTTESLIPASSSSFSTRFFSAVGVPTRSIRYRVRSRGRRIGAGGTKLGRSSWRSATLQSRPNGARRSLDVPAYASRHGR